MAALALLVALPLAAMAESGSGLGAPPARTPRLQGGGVHRNQQPVLGAGFPGLPIAGARCKSPPIDLVEIVWVEAELEKVALVIGPRALSCR